MNKTHHSNILFTRDEGDGNTTIALVSILTRRVMNYTESKIGAVKEAVGRWVKNTKAGAECWKQSSEDLNIGDLAMYNEEFRTWLKREHQNDLVLADMSFITVSNSVDTMYYDRHLN